MLPCCLSIWWVIISLINSFNSPWIVILEIIPFVRIDAIECHLHWELVGAWCYLKTQVCIHATPAHYNHLPHSFAEIVIFCQSNKIFIVKIFDIILFPASVPFWRLPNHYLVVLKSWILQTSASHLQFSFVAHWKVNRMRSLCRFDEVFPCHCNI